MLWPHGVESLSRVQHSWLPFEQGEAYAHPIICHFPHNYWSTWQIDCPRTSFWKRSEATVGSSPKSISVSSSVSLLQMDVLPTEHSPKMTTVIGILGFILTDGFLHVWPNCAFVKQPTHTYVKIVKRDREVFAFLKSISWFWSMNRWKVQIESAKF